jgi:exosortase/archaeosortase family protein
MMKWQKIRQSSAALLHESTRTAHNQIVSCGLLVVGLGYLPFRLGDILLRSLHGSSVALMLAVLCLGVYQLWRKRGQLAKLNASEEDQFMGHVLVLSGSVLFPFCFSSMWAQTLICLIILGAIACSTWGLAFFRVCLLPASLISVGLTPNPGIVGHALWQTFVPPLMLERFTAWLGFWGLRAINQPVQLEGDMISLHNGSLAGSVQVSWGCTGFSMAMSVAVAGLLMGLFFKQPLTKVLLLMVAGIILALTLNIPRVVLLALAVAYWGDSYFRFWHEGLGTQIFSTVLFTIYYYAAMPLLKPKAAKPVD